MGPDPDPLSYKKELVMLSTCRGWPSPCGGWPNPVPPNVVQWAPSNSCLKLEYNDPGGINRSYEWGEGCSPPNVMSPQPHIKEKGHVLFSGFVLFFSPPPFLLVLAKTINEKTNKQQPKINPHPIKKLDVHESGVPTTPCLRPPTPDVHYLIT